MHEQLPFVSIVIPTLNGASDIPDCIDALQNQDYPKDRFEIIVIDNGSNDDSVRIIEKLDLVFDIEPRKGRVFALNRGVRKARGEIIITTDISCIAESNWLRETVQSFSDASVGCVAGEIKQRILKRNFAISYQERHNYMSPMHANNRTPPFLPFSDGASSSFRREVFEKIGLFDESFFKGGDVEFCYRMLLFSDYTIAFNEKAIVWEEGEADIRTLLKQRFRMGQASVLIDKKFCHIINARYNLIHQKKTLKSYYWKNREFLTKTIQFIKCAALSPFSKEKRLETFDKLMVFGMSIAQNLGRLKGRTEQLYNPEKYKLREPPILDA